MNTSNQQTKRQNNRATQLRYLEKKSERPGYSGSTELLTMPTKFDTKLTARSIRKLQRKREIRYVSTETAKLQSDRQYERVKTLVMGRLIGLINKTKRRIAEATRLLAELDAKSAMRGAMEATKQAEENLLVSAQNEYLLRTNNGIPSKDCRAPNVRRAEALRKAVVG